MKWLKKIGRHSLVTFVGSFMLVGLPAGAHAEPMSKQRLKAYSTLPDWTGMWEPQEYNGGASGKAKPGTVPFMVTRPMAARPPYRQEWQQKIAQVMSANKKGGPKCIFGFPELMSSQLMFQVFIAPEETALIFSGREVRHVYTDGRAHPEAEDLWETPWGNSIGHWEGETLVIDTIAAESLEGKGVTESYWSPQAHFVERIRMVSKDKLEDLMTIDDPVALTTPWELALNYKRVTDIDRMIDEDCIGNERNFTVDGKAGFVLK